MTDCSGLGGVELSRILAGRAHAPVVYFARMGGGNVKIGTSTNLKGRMQSFYLSLEDVVLVVPGGAGVEDAYHERFASSQIKGDGRRELFRLDGELLGFLSSQRASAMREAGSLEPGLLTTLRRACDEEVLLCSLDAARKAAQRHGFPEVQGWDKSTALYDREDLMEYQAGKVRVSR